MIAQIYGKLIHKSPDYLIVDVNGVGYGIHTSLSTFYQLPDIDGTVQLNTYTHVREDILQLYGFLTIGERDLFELLLSVSGIGPKLAANILSGIPVSDLRQALLEEDIRKLTATPGVGRKTAERMVLELRDKIGRISLPDEPSIPLGKDEADVDEDVVSALMNLGYKKVFAERALEEAKSIKKGDTFTVEDLLKEALKVLSK